VARLLSDAARVLRHDVGFEPATTSRVFRLLAPDLVVTLMPSLIAQLARQAPSARLEIFHLLPDQRAALEDGGADVAVGPALSAAAGLRTRALGSVHFAVVARRGHPAFDRRSRLTTKRWLGHGHVMVRTGNESRSVVDAALEREGLTRRLGLVVPSFLAALVAVSGSDLMFTAPRELVAPVARGHGLVAVRPPIAIPDMRVAALWHERFDADPGHRFFKTMVGDELRAALSTAAASP
jgi:DNA-binding transcriptional LysR family regulator